MPLVEIHRTPGWRHASELENYKIIKNGLPRFMTEMIPENADQLGIEPNTPPAGVQVLSRDLDPADLNIPNLWIKVQFSEECPPKAMRDAVRDLLYSLITQWLMDRGFILEEFVIDIFWGPTSGKGIVSGAELEW